MSTNELTSKVTELKELQIMAKQLQDEIDTIQEEIKSFMGSTETLTAGPYTIRWQTITSTRIDTTALKKALPDIAAQFQKTSNIRRFTID